MKHLINNASIEKETGVIFEPYCNVNEKDDTFEFGLELIDKPSYINLLEYEYEIYIPQVPFYYFCLAENSDFKQENLFKASLLKNKASFSIEIVVRILKYWTKN